MTATATKPKATKKWNKAAIKTAIIAAHAEKGDVPTSTDMSKRLFGLPYPQAVIDAYGSTHAAIKDAGFVPKGKPMSKAARAKIKAGMAKRKTGAVTTLAGKPAAKKVIKKTTTKKVTAKTARKAPAQEQTPSPSLKSAVAKTLSSAFAKQQFCQHCETTFVGQHSDAECRDNLVARIETMRSTVAKSLPAQDRDLILA
jgi:hypothetical protein